ncbi:MAG: LptF/LptG family permease, partial [Gemmatimonadales bacterium]
GMRLISRHILRSLAAPFFWGVVALTGLMLLNALPPLIDQFGGKSLPASIMIRAVLLFLPALLALTIPMAVLVSTLYGYSQLAGSLETVAMYANGISVWRMARPALIGAAVIAAINFVVFDQVTPWSNTRFADLRGAVINKSPTLALQQQVLNVLPAPSGYVLRADRIDPATGAMDSITIFDLSGSDYDTRRMIIADSGSMAESPNGNDLILLLHHGVTYEFKHGQSGELQQTQFVHTRVVIRDVQNQLRLSANPQGRDEHQKTGCDLLRGIDEQRWEADRNRAAAEYLARRDLRRLAGLPPIAAPNERTPAFPEHCATWRRVSDWIRQLILPKAAHAQLPPAAQQPVQKPAAQQPVAPPPRPALPGAVVGQPPPRGFLTPPQPASQATFFNDTWQGALFNEQLADGSQEAVRRYQVEYHQRFAIPLSSFCFVLIGIALALKYPASGIGLVIGGSLVIFLGFYIMLQGGKGIAVAGHLPPALALHLPLAVFSVVGLVALNAANREMGTARGEGFFAAIASAFRRWRNAP